MFGPHLEEQLAARGYTFGHFPDSFTHSTLGGWIATRSSGMQSDRYGDIADMTKGLRVVTPSGTLVTRPMPASSTGPSIREMVLGSEGRLGIITEATVQVRRIPDKRVILGYLFPTFSRRACRDAGDRRRRVLGVGHAGLGRERDRSSRSRCASRPTLLDKLQSRALRIFLRRRLGFDLDEMCLSFIGYEGSERHVAAQRRAVGKLVKRHGGLCIGSGPGALYDQKKFDIPYIRDFLLDRGAAGDVSETATTWSSLMPLYDAVTAAANGAFAQVGVQGYLMCHLSHSYHAGACLYFTFAFKATSPAAMVAEYEVVKSAIQQAFVDNGATLSHHHAVGTEHAQWLEQDISAPGRGDARGAVRRDRPRAAPEPREDRRHESPSRRTGAGGEGGLSPTPAAADAPRQPRRRPGDSACARPRRRPRRPSRVTPRERCRQTGRRPAPRPRLRRRRPRRRAGRPAASTSRSAARPIPRR